MEVCIVIFDKLKEEYFKILNSEEKWFEIVELFFFRWNIFNNIGVIDGKRIVI